MTRVQDDLYETPSWCVDRLLERVSLPYKGTWFEPCAGNRAIVSAVNAWVTKHRPNKSITWRTNDIRGGQDYLEMRPDFKPRPSVVITNPPYKHAFEIVQKVCADFPSSFVVMLLRLNFLASQRRQSFFAKHMPDVFVLPNRPSFVDGGYDNSEYAWFVWRKLRGDHWPYNVGAGTITVLSTTPKSIRQRNADSRGVKIQIDYRPRDLTHRCQGCGEWLTAVEVQSHCRMGGHDIEGNPWPEPCGPIDEVPRDDITIWLRDQDEAGCREAADELDAMRKSLSDLAEAGTGYSQQTVDALTKERDWLQQELTRLTAALTTIERSGAPGATIVAKRDDGHACGWCRGMLTPCPVETARKALEEK